MVMPQIRDLLYFDFEKASSIWSQLQWGHPEKIAVTTEENIAKQVATGLGIPKVAEANFQIGEGEKRTILETRILHHDLLNRIEAYLSSAGLVINLSGAISPDESSPEVIRATIGQIPFVVATGWSVIEDYRRILSIAERFNDLIEFISQSAIEGIKKKPEYQELARVIEESKQNVRSITDRNKKALAKAKMQKLEDELNKMLESQVSKVDDWILDGIKHWITTFLPSRINFRVYPFTNCPSFQILCNLKRDSFVDQDLEHLLYGYGTRPNIPLSIFGLITSIPPAGGELFDPLSEFDEHGELSNEMAFERAIRGIFGAMDGLEDFAKYSRYPNITVHPIAVFQAFPIANQLAT
jgi:hypothetical protein